MHGMDALGPQPHMTSHANERKHFGLCRISPRIGSISFNFIPISRENAHLTFATLFFCIIYLYDMIMIVKTVWQIRLLLFPNTKYLRL